METLTRHIRAITQAAFTRYGFAQGDVIAHWAEIVGADLAECSVPERIRWPKPAGPEAPPQGGTLVVRAAPGRALEIQYEASRIIARINSFFGYGAIAKLKVLSAAELMPQPRKAGTGTSKTLCKQELDTFSDDDLKAALERLGKGVAGASPSSPQGK